MKQILQSFSSGETLVADVPSPGVKRGQLLIRTHASLVSAGTERMLVDFGKANLLQKALQQPEQLRLVLDKVKTDGLLPTWEAVRNKLDQPKPLGYCNVGTVLGVGAGAEDFQIGDRVASNGGHAEVVSVPRNLCAKVPARVTDAGAAFTVLGAIALQGVRLAGPTLGEYVVVTGLGLVGLITVQLLRAHGCKVLGVDHNTARCTLAHQFGAETVDASLGQDLLATAAQFTRGRGVDAVLLTAATKSSEPVHQAAQMCRKRGRIVLVGVTGLELSRTDFYEKELTFQVSCSYGPGRYDPRYEEGGQDYPLGFVRWTEQRNFDAILDMLADGKLDFEPLISHRFAIGEASRAYELLSSDQPSLGILLEYPTAQQTNARVAQERTIALHGTPAVAASPAVGFIGSGSYASQVLIPAFKKAGAHLHTIASTGGVSAAHAGRKFAFESATTDADLVLAHASINVIAIATRHDSHASLAAKALSAGKHVFVEKPLALDEPSLASLEQTYARLSTASRARTPLLMVGFNRRFSALVQKTKSLLDTVNEPKTFIYTVNAGALAPEHWTQDPETGGGRIIGEGCHFIDLLRYLAGTPITRIQAAAQASTRDIVSFTLGFADGSMGTIHYLANGHKAFPKERLETFCAGRILQLDNFRRLRGYGWPGFRKLNLWRQDKGNAHCAKAFLDAVREARPSPIAFQELVEVTRASFRVAQALGNPAASTISALGQA